MPNCFTDLQAETALRRALIHPPHMALRGTPRCFSSTFAQFGSPRVEFSKAVVRKTDRRHKTLGLDLERLTTTACEGSAGSDRGLYLQQIVLGTLLTPSEHEPLLVDQTQLP